MSKLSERLKGTFCVWFGHSKIVTMCFGYVYCARCGDQIGDRLGGADNGERQVIVDHNCDKCQSNYKKLTWRDKLFAPNPLKGEVRL